MPYHRFPLFSHRSRHPFFRSFLDSEWANLSGVAQCTNALWLDVTLSELTEDESMNRPQFFCATNLHSVSIIELVRRWCQIQHLIWIWLWLVILIVTIWRMYRRSCKSQSVNIAKWLQAIVSPFFRVSSDTTAGYVEMHICPSQTETHCFKGIWQNVSHAVFSPFDWLSGPYGHGILQSF